MRPWIAVTVWILTIGVGLHYLWGYENRAAQTVKASVRMPAHEPGTLHPVKPTIIVFAHPHCPCSRASISELERVLGTYEDRFAVRVYFYVPRGKEENWYKSDLYRRVLKMPSTAVTIDPDGMTAKKFSATTSGEVFVYAPDAELLYHGGLTSARGHEGASIGTKSLGEIAETGRSEVVEAAVFGCTLFQDTKKTLGGS